MTSAGATRPLPGVVVLTTGGTIASRHDPALGGLVPSLTGEALLAAVPALARLARVEVEPIAAIGSADMTPQIWLRLAARILENLPRPDISGAVVTHGTDTLEETAYFLDLAVAGGKPVVVTGAQRAASEPDSDGPRNLLDAVRVCSSPEAAGKGVVVVMDGRIHAARDATKTSTVQPGTFRSPEFGALGAVDPGGVRFHRAPLRRQSIPVDPGTRLGRVEIVPHYAGADGRLVRLLLRDAEPPPLDGLVVAAAGLGHVSEGMHDAIREARERGLPVVISTRVPTGRVLPLYAGVGRTIALRGLGCVLAGDLSPHKARVLLMLALTRTRDPAEIQAHFDR